MGMCVENESTADQQTRSARGLNGWYLAGGILFAILVSVIISVWLVSHWLFPQQLEPVVLAPQETRVLEQKLGGLQAEPYDESAASREILFSERELNALLARNPQMAQRMAIHLDKDLASATLLLPLEPDFPLLGGQTLRITAGVELRQWEARPVIILRGVSVWGVPLPNSWLGGLKHIDLIEAFGHEPGLWKALAEGIAEVEVQRGQLRIRLKE